MRTVYKTTDGKLLRFDGKLATSDYCCTCVPRTNCSCEVSDPLPNVNGTLWEPDFADETDDLWFNGLYPFTHDKPFSVTAFLEDSSGDLETLCYCANLVSDDCSLLCNSDNLLEEFFCGNGFGTDPCYRCVSNGSGGAGDPGGKVHGDPCIHGAPSGAGSRPGDCIKSDGLVSVGEPCCKWKGVYEFTPNSSCGGWTVDLPGRCVLPRISPGFPDDGLTICNDSHGATFGVWCDRDIYNGATGGPLNFCWWGVLSVSVGGGSGGFFARNRKYLYRAPLDVQPVTGCVLTRGWHNLLHVATIDGTFSGDEMDWCPPPASIPILAHGVGA